jgi:tRNA(Arg) A34 adenosine deaminase TadA
VVVKDGRVIGEGWNQVTSHNDPTAHAEIVAIRAACRTQGGFSLEGTSIYTTCEPCPMCLAAIYWARIGEVFYGNSTEDADSIGFDDGAFYREIARAREERSIAHVRLLPAEARSVFDEWLAMDDRVQY